MAATPGTGIGYLRYLLGRSDPDTVRLIKVKEAWAPGVLVASKGNVLVIEDVKIVEHNPKLS